MVPIFVTFLTTVIGITANSTGTSSSDRGAEVATTDPYPLRLSDAADELEVSLRQLSITTIRTLSSSKQSHHNQNHTNDVIVSDMCELWYQSLRMIHWLVEQLLNATTVEDEATTRTQTIEPHDLTRIVSHLLLSSSSSVSSDSSVSSSNPSSCIPTNATATALHHLSSFLVPRIRRVTDQPQFQALLSHLRKIPLLILDDLTDVFTTTQAHQFWTRTLLTPFLRPVPKKQCRPPDAYPLFFSNPLWYTNRRPTSTTTAVAVVGGNVNTTTSSGTNPSWLLFLKISNKLIRRLQQSSERHTGIPTCTSSLSSPMVISLLLQLLSTVYSMSEKSSTRVWGSYNEHKAVVAHVGTTNHAMTTTTSPETVVSIAQGSSHDLYTIFWKLQDDFRHPNGIVVSDFINRLQLMLRTMETSHTGTRPSTIASKQLNEASLDQLHNEMNIYILSTPFGLSQDDRILTIQLQQDATIRNILIVQMYMILHHLLIQVPLLRTQLQSHLQTLGSIVRSSDENCRKLVHTALHLLNHSEMNWRQWKQQKCLPDIEQPRKHQKKSASSATATTFLSSRKRKRIDSTNYIDAENGDRTQLMEVSTKMRKKFVPTIQDHCQEYVEALDPEAGIDDEYHPKHDTMFSWQALRLLAFHDRTSSEGVNDATGDDLDDGDYLSQFQHILPNGDYENMIRHVYQTKYNILVPGEGPQPYIYIPEENAEEVNDILSKEHDRNKNGADNIEGMVTENDKIDAEMADGPSSPNVNDHVDQEPDDGGVSASANEASNDDPQNVSIDDVNGQKHLTSNPGSDDIATMNHDQSKDMPMGKANGDAVSVNSDEKRSEQTTKETSTTGSSIVTEKTNNSRSGDSQSNLSSKTQSSQRQSSSSSTSGVGDRTSSVRSNSHPTGPSQQQQVSYGSNKPRETTVEQRSHNDTYSRSRNDGYNSSASANRSYHTMDHGGRLSSRGDVVLKDHVSSSAPLGGRSRDDVPRGNLRDEQQHHHRGPGGGGDGAQRWDGGEWRSDHPRGQGPEYHHHGRGGSTSSSANHDRGSGRDHNNRGTTGTGGTGNSSSSSYRSRNNGSTWPRDMDSSNSRR